MTFTSEQARRAATIRHERNRAAKRGPEPFAGTILDALDAAGMAGPSWAPWRTFWKGVYALPMDEAERELFTRCTGRTIPPATPVHEAWLVVGRRGGKTRNDAVAAMYEGTRRDYRTLLAPGERAVIPIIAADRKQSRQVLDYLKGLATSPTFKPNVGRMLKEAVELRTGVTVEVHTASYRTVRGYSVPLAVADEAAFWRTEDSAQPDTEILAALRPGMANVPDALLVGSSTPYARRGELFRAYERFYGQDDAAVLVWVAPSRTMNPTLAESVVTRAYEDDPLSAAAEYGAEFRRDVEAFLDAEAVQAVTIPNRRELPPVEGVRYMGFVDPSGGSQDSFTVAVAHREDGRAILDCLRERRPPFSPDSVVAEFAAVLKSYHCSSVVGDKYAGLFPRELFGKQGIRYEVSARVKSDIYREVLAPINAGRVELLDHGRLKTQLIGLERRVARGGKDSVDHAPGGRDDLANAASGALVLAVEKVTSLVGGVSIPRAGSPDVARETVSIFDLMSAPPRPPWAGGSGPLP